MRYLGYILFMLSAGLFSAIATANDQPDADQLIVLSCHALKANQQDETVQPCINYLKGFLAGVIVTDAVKAIEPSAKANKRPSFVERAHSTRVGEQGNRLPVIHFCIPRDETQARIIAKLTEQLTLPIPTTKLLRNRVYSALKVAYPCEKPAKK